MGQLTDQVGEFIGFLQVEKNYSPETVKAYRRDLSEFTAYLGDPSPEVEEIDHITIRDFLGHLQKKGNSRASMARKLAAIRSFFRHLHRIERIERNPARLVRTPKLAQLNPRHLTEEEVSTILDLPDLKTPLGSRDHAMLELLYAAGLRVGELVATNLEDISLSQRLVKVRGKGRKERLVPFGTKAQGALRAYLRIRGDLLKKARRAHQPAALFLSARGSRITARSVERILSNYVRKAALLLDVHPHLFRHSFATHLLNRGSDLRVIQELLGHESLSTTQKYTHLATGELLRTYRAAHPRAREARGGEPEAGSEE